LNRESTSHDEIELKRTLYESMKNSGVLGSLKSQLRSKLYDQLKIKQDQQKAAPELTKLSRILHAIVRTHFISIPPIAPCSAPTHRRCRFG